MSSSNASVISWSWDSYGNLTSETDPKGNITNYTYDGNSLYLAQKVQAAGTSVQRTFTYGWDQYFGLVTAKNDVDNSLTTNYAYDAIGRAIKVTEGAGSAVRQTNTTYSDANRTITVKHDQTASGDGVLTNVTTYDPLYRVALTQQLEGSGDTSGIKVQTRYQYSGNNSYKLISNPFRTSGDSTMGWTALTYDQNGRFISSQSFSGSSLPAPWGNNATSSGAVTTSYDAQNTTINDQAGSRRLTSTDGLGRLGSVTEYPGTGSWTTSYAYDALSDLKSVNQSGLARTFLYDSLQRLVASTNPENSSAGSAPALGCINGAAPYANCYYYDSNGNLTQKVDNRGIGTKYAYDPLNRLLRKTYFNLSGSVNYQGAGYTYDASSVPYARGRLTSTATMAGAYLNANGTSVTNYLGYDALGRVTGSNQVMNGAIYPFSYSYNLADGLTSENYPSGRVVTTCYDGANRQSQVLLKGSCSTSSGTPYVSNVTYAAQGVETQYLLGSNITRNLPYNARLQLSGFADALGNSPLVNATLNWGTTNNNGNLQSAVYTHSGQGYSTPVSFTESFSYDGVNRLMSASDSGGWSRGFSYDAYGNMTPSGNPAPPPVSFNTNNQIVSQSYDQAGNQLSVNGNTVAYNSENLVMSETDGVTRAVETHAYDADGRRVKKYGPAGTTVFLYDALGRMAMEVSSAVSAPTCLTCYFSTDHLGSTRLITDRLGTVVARHDFMPFGEEVGSNSFGRNNQFGAGNDTINQKFTGKERDSESGLDYFGARYYGSALGRFTSPDPLLNSGHPDDPQSWNRYTYALNNPLAITDPTGLYNLVNSCDSNNKGCNKDFNTNAKNLKNAISALTKAVNSLKDGDQKTALSASLKALGTENDGNNVNVQFGKTSDNSAAQTVPGADSNGNVSFTITFDPSRNEGLNNEAVNAAHEGTHVADISDPRFNDSATTLSPFSQEYRGYRTSAYAAAALGEPSWSFKGQNGKGSYPIWNGSWGAVDKNITNYVTTFRDKNGQPDHPETTPHDPWNK